MNLRTSILELLVISISIFGCRGWRPQNPNRINIDSAGIIESERDPNLMSSSIFGTVLDIREEPLQIDASPRQPEKLSWMIYNLTRAGQQPQPGLGNPLLGGRGHWGNPTPGNWNQGNSNPGSPGNWGNWGNTTPGNWNQGNSNPGSPKK